MGSIVIRNLDDELKAALRIRAAEHGHSMEAEVRNIIKDQLSIQLENTPKKESAGQVFSRLFGKKAGDNLEEFLPDREVGRKDIEF